MSSPTLPELLAGMRNVIEKATEPPWASGVTFFGTVTPNKSCRRGVFITLNKSEHSGDAKRPLRQHAEPQIKADCDFVAAARTQWPATVKALEVAIRDLTAINAHETLSQIESILRAAK